MVGGRMKEFVIACLKGEIDEKTCEKIYLQTSIMAELDAVNLYQAIARRTTNQKIRITMLDIAKEEKTHIGEFQYLLKEIDAEFKQELEKGEQEVIHGGQSLY